MRKKSLLALTVIVAVFVQAGTVFAVSEVPASNFFENAWQEATISQSYSFTCTVTSSNPKAMPNTLTGDEKKKVDLALAALKKYKRVTQGAILGEKHQLSTSQAGLNTLGILDQMSAGKFTLDHTIQEVKALKNKKIDLVIADDAVYFKGSAKWETFQSADAVSAFYAAASDSPFTQPLEKASFVFKNYEKSGSSNTAVYNGLLTASETTSLLAPFLGEAEAAKLAPAPVKLFITGDGHIKKLSIIDKVVIGGLSFTVKEQCSLKLKNVKIKIPSGATSVGADVGQQDLLDLTQTF